MVTVLPAACTMYYCSSVRCQWLPCNWMPIKTAPVLKTTTLNRNRKSGNCLAGAAQQVADCMRPVTVRRGGWVSLYLLLIRAMT